MFYNFIKYLNKFEALWLKLGNYILIVFVVYLSTKTIYKKNFNSDNKYLLEFKI